MTLEVDKIVECLPNLTPADRAKVRVALDMLDTNPNSNLPSQKEDVPFQALLSVLQAHGIRHSISFEQFSSMKAYKSWKSGLPEFEEFVKHSFKKYIKSKNERLALYKLLMDVLVDDMKEIGIPITVSTVVSNLSRVSEAFTRSFPGYLECGLEHVIVAAMKGKKINE